MKQIITTALSLCAAIILWGCETKIEKAVEKTAFGFIDGYFSWHYNDCAKLLTEDSKKWISFIATNIEEGDIAEYNKQRENISYEIKDIRIENDSMAQVKVRVENAVLPDNLEGGVRVINGPVDFHLAMIQVDKKWLVVLDGPLTR